MILTVWVPEGRKKLCAVDCAFASDKDEMYIKAGANKGTVYGISSEEDEPSYIRGFLKFLAK
ncbi:MAG: hypothetical protein ACI4CS_04595 [Candidatus Weimeria sp.]